MSCGGQYIKKTTTCGKEILFKTEMGTTSSILYLTTFHTIFIK